MKRISFIGLVLAFCTDSVVVTSFLLRNRALQELDEDPTEASNVTESNATAFEEFFEDLSDFETTLVIAVTILAVSLCWACLILAVVCCLRDKSTTKRRPSSLNTLRSQQTRIRNEMADQIRRELTVNHPQLKVANTSFAPQADSNGNRNQVGSQRLIIQLVTKDGENVKTYDSLEAQDGERDVHSEDRSREQLDDSSLIGIDVIERRYTPREKVGEMRNGETEVVRPPPGMRKTPQFLHLVQGDGEPTMRYQLVDGEGIESDSKDFGVLESTKKSQKQHQRMDPLLPTWNRSSTTRTEYNAQRMNRVDSAMVNPVIPRQSTRPKLKPAAKKKRKAKVEKSGPVDTFAEVNEEWDIFHRTEDQDHLNVVHHEASKRKLRQRQRPNESMGMTSSEIRPPRRFKKPRKISNFFSNFHWGLGDISRKRSKSDSLYDDFGMDVSRTTQPKGKRMDRFFTFLTDLGNSSTLMRGKAKQIRSKGQSTTKYSEVQYETDIPGVDAIQPQQTMNPSKRRRLQDSRENIQPDSKNLSSGREQRKLQQRVKAQEKARESQKQRVDQLFNQDLYISTETL